MSWRICFWVVAEVFWVKHLLGIIGIKLKFVNNNWDYGYS